MTAPSEPRIAAHGLAVGRRRGEPFLSGIDLEVRGGTTTALVGRSGCGKTTLLRTVGGLQPALSGEVSVLQRTPGHPLLRGRVAYIPQTLGLVGNATALRNVLLGTSGRLGAWRSLLGAFPASSVARARHALDAVGLGDKLHRRPRELSGGERRRVAIARALAQEPEVLLADEILSELDVATAQTVTDAVALLQRETGMAILLVEHNLDVACAVADEVVGLQDGSVAARFRPGSESSGHLREVLHGR